MRSVSQLSILLILLFADATTLSAHQAGVPVTISAAHVIDVRGVLQLNVDVTVRGAMI